MNFTKRSIKVFVKIHLLHTYKKRCWPTILFCPYFIEVQKRLNLNTLKFSL